jgi:hypothetical protein
MTELEESLRCRPWYREPWPWILMAGPFAVIIAGLFTAWLAVTRADPLVVDNYYKEGLAINQVIARDQAAAMGGYRAEVVFGQSGSRVRLRLDGVASLPATVRLSMVHPTRLESDRTIEMRSLQGGWYEGEVVFPSAARWRLQLEDPQRAWRLTGAWQPTDGGGAVLTPRG